MITSTADADELAKFQLLDWWDPQGSYAQLHQIHPVRMQWIADTLRARLPDAASALDVGCGGGLVTESLYRLGISQVTGIDLNDSALQIALSHAQSAFGAVGGADSDAPSPITYRCMEVAALAAEIEQGKTPPFDVVTSLEVIEHVREPASFVRALAGCVKPGGIVILSTIARTRMAKLLAVEFAETIGMVPSGTHDWRKFVLPSELASMGRVAGLTPSATQGMVFNPLTQQWTMHPTRLRMNYFMVLTRQDILHAAPDSSASGEQ